MTVSVRVLVLNPGSSTLKATVLEPPDRSALATVEVERGDDASRGRDSGGRAVEGALAAIRGHGIDVAAIGAVGYRVVHGASHFREPVVIDDAVVERIEALGTLAPLHNAVAAATIRAGRAAVPAATHVACFDTAFHASLPEDAVRYAVPARWVAERGVRRYGFHGLSVQWATRRVAELLDRPPHELGIVVAHLGSGCSVTAVDGGRSVDTSMGMTPLEGLVMGTRAGSLDPGIILMLLRERSMTAAELAEDLDHRSGLLGLSERSADVRELLAAEADGDDAARLALAVFVRRAAAGIAAAATALPRVDVLVFTGGIGEHSSEIRRRIVGRLSPLGVDGLRDAEPATAEWVLEARSGPAIAVVRAREDVVVAEAAAALAGRGTTIERR